jgi:hypothetical protein
MTLGGHVLYENFNDEMFDVLLNDYRESKGRKRLLN